MGTSGRRFYRATRRRPTVASLICLVAAWVLGQAAAVAQDHGLAGVLAVGAGVAVVIGLACLRFGSQPEFRGVEVREDGLTVVPANGPSRFYPWSAVRPVSGGVTGEGIRVRGEMVNLAHEFNDVSRVAILRAVQLAVRPLGAGGEQAEVEPALIQEWLALGPGQRRHCYCAWGRWLGEIYASDAGLDVRAWPRRLFVPWSDLRDLQMLAGRSPGARCWQVVHKQGRFLFEAGWVNADLLARAIEGALAEQAVGHRLPGAAEASAPAGAISIANASPPSAERGISLPDDGPEQPSR